MTENVDMLDINLTVNVSNPMHYLDEGSGNHSFPQSMSISEATVTAIALSMITLCTVVGNVLVILSVFTYKPLRIAQNFFLVSLALADLTVAVLVMPFNIAYTIRGRWDFGLALCKMWLTCDVLCCTASILNLCAIAMDRYRAIHDPINYAQKRTLKRVLAMIFLVWTISGVICLPPLIGWNDWPEHFEERSPCELTRQQGYVIYSSCGSFFIPLVIMTLVYIKIFAATKRRLRERAKRSAAVISCNSHTGGGGSSGTPRIVPVHSDDSCPVVAVAPSISLKEDNHNDSLCLNVMLKDDSDCVHQPSASTAGGRLTVNAVTPTCESRTVLDGAEESFAGENQPQLSKTDSRTTQSNSPIHQFIEERQKISLSKERRAARILGIVMGVFVVCWLPFFLMYLVTPFCDVCRLSKVMENFITWLGYANSALNPVIYTIFNMDFRRAFFKLLKCSRA